MGSHPTSPVKVTDLLINMLNKASNSQGGYEGDLEALRGKHEKTASALLGAGSAEYTTYMELLDKEVTGIVAMLRAVEVAGMKVDQFEEFVIGHGELWSARMTAYLFQQRGYDCEFMDARDVLVVRPSEVGEDVDVIYPRCNERLDGWARGKGVPKVVVCTGFVARTEDDRITTLKRNGSDYTATIYGNLLEAKSITIWTDVNGVYSADPRKVKDAEPLDVMSYNEAWELAYFGANVLHPRSTLPAMQAKIPVILRNMFDRSHKGTTITTKEKSLGGRAVKGFASIDNVSLIEVTGSGLVGVPGTAAAIFGAVRDANVNVVMISQSSSEHSVCFAVKMADSERAIAALNKRFEGAIENGRIQKVYKVDNCTVLAAVGEAMASSKGISARLFSALAKSGVNIRATAQGASEFNITVVIDGADSSKALRAVHTEFYSRGTPLAIGLIGPGLVGGTLLNQLKDQVPALRSAGRVDMRVNAIATSQKMLLSDSPIDLGSWESRFEAEAVPCDLTKMSQHLKEMCSNAVMIDCTAAEGPPAMYPEFVRQGCHVITPNKKMGSGDLSRYTDFFALLRERGLTWHYETTVGAGLPVLYTLQHLVRQRPAGLAGPPRSPSRSARTAAARTARPSQRSPRPPALPTERPSTPPPQQPRCAARRGPRGVSGRRRQDPTGLVIPPRLPSCSARVATARTDRKSVV